MKFIKELSQQLEPSWWASKSVLCFSGPAYPLLFLTAWQQRLRSVLSQRFIVCDLEKQDVSALKNSLGTSFLGESCIYYLGDLSQLPAKKRDLWEQYCANYRGPHCLIVCTGKDKAFKKNDAAVVVELPEWLNQQECFEMLGLCMSSVELARCKPLVTAVFKRQGRVQFDQGYWLGFYARLMGNQVDEFMRTWLELIIPNEASLFELSGALFAGKREEFFKKYQTLKDLYPLPFWITFWSEQLFRATYFSQYRKDSRLQEAKQISFRLPFSFIQKDWRSMSPEKLKAGHELLYEIDYSFKNGGSDTLLENFYFHML